MIHLNQLICVLNKKFQIDQDERLKVNNKNEIRQVFKAFLFINKKATHKILLVSG